MKIEIAENEVTLKLNKEQFQKIIHIINEENCVNKKYVPKTKEELKKLIEDEEIYLGDIDTSNITDMSYLFYQFKRTDFSGIENWDTSNVKNMSFMFALNNVNPDVSKWDVSNVTNMCSMFSTAYNADPDVSNWDVSNVTDMSWMFYKAIQANPDVSNWDFSKIKYANKAFLKSKFDYNTLKSTNFDLNKFFQE